MEIKDYVNKFKIILAVVKERDLALAIMHELRFDERKEENNLASNAQKDYMKKLDKNIKIPVGMTREEASKVIDELKNKEKRY